MARQAKASLRCAPYLRCSSDDQKHGDFSTIAAQRDINDRHITSLGGINIGEYNDEGRTGTNLKRKDWRRLLADAQAGLLDCVVVSYMSRLARGECFYIAEYLLKEAGVQVIMVKEQFTPDLAGYANKTMKVFLDGMFPKQVSEWTKTKQAEMVAHGYRMGGILPFGYSAVYISDPALARPERMPPKRLVINQAEAPFVHRGFEIFVDTGSYERVREYLRSVTDRDWTLKNAIHLIKNEIYRGVTVFGELRNESSHEPVISAELWTAAQTIVATRLRDAKHEVKDQTSYYLRNIVFCQHCGTRLTPATHHGRASSVAYYECTANTQRKRNCPVKRVNAYSLHEVILDHIRRAATHPTRMTEIIREAVKTVPIQNEIKEQLTAVSKRLRDTEKSIRGVLAAIEAGGAGMKSLLTRLAELEEKQTALRSQQYQLEAAVVENKLDRPDVSYVQGIWSQFLSLWDDATEAERNELMPLLVERVDMTEKERGLVRLSFTGTNPRRFQSPVSTNVLDQVQVGAADRVIAMNQLTWDTGLPPILLDYDIVRRKRAVRRMIGAAI